MRNLRNQSLGSWIARRALLTPKRTALIYRDEQLSYAELYERSIRLAHALIELGVRRTDRVGFYGPNQPGHLETMFACGLLGAIYVPLHARFDPAALEHAINESGCQVLIFGPEVSAMVDELRARLTVRTYVATGEAPAFARDYDELLGAAGNEPIDREVGFDDICLINYTSGTTGTNKGVVLTHGNMAFHIFNVLASSDYMSSDVMLTSAPLFRMGGLGMLTPIFYKGATCVIQPTFDPDQALDLIEQHRVTVLFNGPRQFDQIARSPRFSSADLSSMRFCICGGDAVPDALIRTWLDRGITFQQGYGLTEAAPGVLLLGEHDVFDRAGSAGQQLLFTEVRVVDEEMRDVPPGEVGELVLRGPNVMKGYWEHSDFDDKAFAGGWLHSGDAARVDEDGFFYIVDRVKDVMRIDGEQVYPSEIEKVLAGHPGVAEAAVIAVAQGEAQKPLGFVVAKAGQELSGDELVFYCWKRLPLSRVPTAVRVVDALPRNPNGKLMRRKLRELAQAAPVAPSAPQSVPAADQVAVGSTRMVKPATSGPVATPAPRAGARASSAPARPRVAGATTRGNGSGR